MNCANGGYCIDDICYGGSRMCDGLEFDPYDPEWTNEELAERGAMVLPDDDEYQP